MILYHPYADPISPQQRPTWDALSLLMADYYLRNVPCGQDDRYESAFIDAWTTDTSFIVCEHDIVPSHAALQSLSACPHPFCAQAYLLVHDMSQIATLREILPIIESSDTGRQWRGYNDLHPYLDAVPDRPDILAYHTAAHRVVTKAGWRWIRQNEEWADYVGFGLTKFTPFGQPGWRAGSWRDLDSRVSEWTHNHGVRWHIHWPIVKHYHVLGETQAHARRVISWYD